jgi:parallel beta-helix repeat protein
LAKVSQWYINYKKITSMVLVILCCSMPLSIIYILSHTENIIIASGVTNKNLEKTSIGKENDAIHSINNTVLASPTDRELADIIANKIDLSFYTSPKNTDLIIEKGNWTMEQLHKKYPMIIQSMTSKEIGQNDSFLITKTIVIERGTELNIVNNKVYLESSSKKDNIPATIITYGKTTIINSTISSWDLETNSPDPNPYHPRAFLVANDGGIMNIIKSTISNMGFSQGGILSLFSSVAGINYYNTSNFILKNSTITNNLYGFLSDNTSNFKIIGNNIYDHIGYGIDILTESKDFLIDSNHIRFSGLQGIICSHLCKNATITNNLLEYNLEGIGLYWLSNSSLIKNNIIKYSKNTGIFLKNNSKDNTVEDNTVIGNGYGIKILNGSTKNIIKSNTLMGNILDPDGIDIDKDSKSNQVKDNIISPSCKRQILKDNICD